MSGEKDRKDGETPWRKKRSDVRAKAGNITVGDDRGNHKGHVEETVDIMRGGIRAINESIERINRADARQRVGRETVGEQDCVSRFNTEAV